MVVDLFSKILISTQPLLEPWANTNRALAANIEALAAFQMNALRSCLDIQLNQLRAAAEISDIASLRDFYQRQAEIAKTVHRKMMIDTTALSGMAARLKAEMDELTQTALEEALLKAA